MLAVCPRIEVPYVLSLAALMLGEGKVLVYKETELCK